MYFELFEEIINPNTSKERLKEIENILIEKINL